MQQTELKRVEFGHWWSVPVPGEQSGFQRTFETNNISTRYTCSTETGKALIDLTSANHDTQPD